jgi:ParB-like chromosome segregation protein Spo0J
MRQPVEPVIFPRLLISHLENQAASLGENQPADGGNMAAEPEIATIRCDILKPADTPRLTGESREHIQVLAESPAEFPPILVHKSSMRVIDGMHRLAATRLRGHEEIKVQFFDGKEEDIFAISVQENVTHGLPLSLADRKAAAARIVKANPEWSDRRIASVAGLSHKTIGIIRSAAQPESGESTQLNARRGHDGRLRPLNSSVGRKIAAELIQDNPSASLRTIARKAGISPGTVRDVRDRLKRGLDPVIGRPEHHSGTAAAGRRDPAELPHCGAENPAPPGSGDHQNPRIPAQRGRSYDNAVIPLSASATDKILQRLRSDPALRFSETGRSILRHLHYSTNSAVAFGRFIDNVPHHRAATIAQLAQANAELWRQMAIKLQQRSS